MTMVKAKITIRDLNIETDMGEVYRLAKKQYSNHVSMAHPTMEALTLMYTHILESGNSYVNLVYADECLLFMIEATDAPKYDIGSLVVTKGDFCLQLLTEELNDGQKELWIAGLEKALAYYFQKIGMVRILIPLGEIGYYPLREWLTDVGFSFYSPSQDRGNPGFLLCTCQTWLDGKDGE